MSLKNRIADEMKAAMKAGERERVQVLRLIMAAIKQVEVDTRSELDDGAVIGVLEKMQKQRRDSVQQYTDGGRKDLADAEQAEIEILSEYLPEQLGEDEIDRIVAAVVDETGAESVRDMGKVMGVLKSRLAGQADMGAVSARVKARLNA